MFIQFWRCSYTVHALFIHFTVHSGARPRSVINLVDGLLHFAGRDCPVRVRFFVLAKKKCGKRRGTSDHLVKVSSPENQMETTSERLDHGTSTCDDNDDNDTDDAKGKDEGGVE